MGCAHHRARYWCVVLHYGLVIADTTGVGDCNHDDGYEQHTAHDARREGDDQEAGSACVNPSADHDGQSRAYGL